MKVELTNPALDKGINLNRVTCGGFWYDGPDDVRASYRDDYAPPARADFIGFRLVRNK